jgi:FkbM family methyltransferase
MVVAFEAVWPMYSELCRNVQYDTIPRSPIIPVPAGLADSERDAPIHVPKGLFEEGSMAEAAAWGRAHAGAEIDVYRARLTTIDSFFSMTGMPPPTFLKIDVEGAELFALRGAAGLFSSGHRPLMLIEVFAPWEKAFGYKPWELFSWLLEWGYRFLFACPSGLVEYLPNESRPFPQEYAMGYNVLAHSPAAHAMRVDGVKHLRAGPLAKLLPMVPPPFPNHTD